jgi:hypothetical protein
VSVAAGVRGVGCQWMVVAAGGAVAVGVVVSEWQ